MIPKKRDYNSPEWRQSLDSLNVNTPGELLQSMNMFRGKSNETDDINSHDKYVIAIDFEAAGGIPSKNGFLSLGATLYSITKQKEVSSFYSWASMDGYEWDERCVSEFWMKHPALYAEALQETTGNKAPSPYQVIDNFMEWVYRHVLVGPIANVNLISDNVAFDVGTLRYFSTKRDIMYMFTDMNKNFVYRDVIDTGSFYYGLGKIALDSVSLDAVSSKKTAKSVVLNGQYENKKAREEHNALDDAREIARLYCAVMGKLFSMIS